MNGTRGSRAHLKRDVVLLANRRVIVLQKSNRNKVSEHDSRSRDEHGKDSEGWQVECDTQQAHHAGQSKTVNQRQADSREDRRLATHTQVLSGSWDELQKHSSTHVEAVVDPLQRSALHRVVVVVVLAA
jgi:hypothetical protein